MESFDGGAPRQRWLGCGHSVDADAFAPASAATRAAIAGRADTQLLIRSPGDLRMDTTYQLRLNAPAEAWEDPDVDRIATLADGAPVAGFYTYGKIARTTGRQGFHNQTLVVLALG